MNQHKILCGAIIIFMLLSSFGLTRAAGQSTGLTGRILYVDVEADGNSSGSSWENAFSNPQQAIWAAEPGDQVWVAAGTYLPISEQYGCGVGERYKTFQLKNGVEVYGGFDPSNGDVSWEDRDWEANATILSGDIGIPGDNRDNSYHVFCHPEEINLSSSAVLDGFTITGGNANHAEDGQYKMGGGMYNSKASPTLTNLTISGNTAGDGNGGNGGGMHGDRSSPVLTNVTFANNSADDYGGGLDSEWGSNPTLINVTFSDNSTHSFSSCGGGLSSNWMSKPTLINVTFIGNVSRTGGGMCNAPDTEAILTHVSFYRNIAILGGGMFNYNSIATLKNVTFSGNSAKEEGGGMYNEYASLTLINVTFSNNSTNGRGGGVSNYSTGMNLTNGTFSENTALYGGGIYNKFYSAYTLSNVTFANNSATYPGGGMVNEDSSPNLNNCIFWGDSPDEIYTFGDSHPLVSYSDIQGGYSGVGNIDADPRLSALGNHGGFVQTYALGEGSPAIEAGNPDPATCPATDARGAPRPSDGDGDGTATCDMGAYELLVVATRVLLPMVVK